jgi:3-hydroxyisobutyrate dehydrogenase
MASTIGYVGVGLMGGPMVGHLLACGNSIRAFDIVPDRLRNAASLGAIITASPAEAAAGADFVILNLPSTAAVEAAMFAPDGVASTLLPPGLVVDLSTIEVERCRSFAARLHTATGCRWVDAPVSGGSAAAGDGTLTVMAGGEEADIARLRPFFDGIAANFTHVGGTGDGLVAKMVSQLIVGCLHVVLAEAERLAELSGIDPASIPACVAGGHADGVLLRQLYPRMVARDFKPRAYARQLVKDLHMVEALTRETGMVAPMLGAASRMYDGLIERGDAELDVSAIVRMYETAPPRRAGHQGAAG